MSPNYKEWVKTIKEGDLVLSVESQWSSPVIFLSWNGDSSKHLYIPTWNIHSGWYVAQPDPQAEVDKQWNSVYDDIKKHGAKSSLFNISPVNARAEKRYFPFPIKFLDKNQLKFIKLINKIKGYEY